MSNENKEWKPGMNMGFKVGDTVYYHGVEGKVNEIDKKNDYPVSAIFGKEYYRFLKDGRYWESDLAPSLFHKPQNYDISRPEWEPKPGEWCWFWDNDTPILAKFNGIDDGRFKALDNYTWDHCAPFKGELPPHLQ